MTKDARERVERTVGALRSYGYRPIQYGDVFKVEDRVVKEVSGDIQEKGQVPGLLRVEGAGITYRQDLGLYYGVKESCHSGRKPAAPDAVLPHATDLPASPSGRPHTATHCTGFHPFTWDMAGGFWRDVLSDRRASCIL